MIGLVQSHYHEGSPVGKRSLRWEGFVEKVCFWAWSERAKEWWMMRAGMMREMVDKWMRRWIETRLVRLTEWIWQLIQKTRWCISKWAICDFQGGDGWRVRKSDNRWGAGIVRRLKRDKVVKIARLCSCKNFVGEREVYIRCIRCQCRDLRMGVICVNLGALTTARAREFWIRWQLTV